MGRRGGRRHRGGAAGPEEEPPGELKVELRAGDAFFRNADINGNVVARQLRFAQMYTYAHPTIMTLFTILPVLSPANRVAACKAALTVSCNIL